MIKFIATDLDGTLLDGQRNLPQEIFPIITVLAGRGILFAPASGRQYANLARLFAPVSDLVLFICENGALVRYRGDTLRLTPIRPALLKPALDGIRSLGGLHPILCGTECAYIEDTEEPFRRLSFEAYTKCVQTDSLDDVIGREEICKIAVYDDFSAENCIRVLPQRLHGLRTAISGENWCDVSAPEANKGAAIRDIQRMFGFGREECVAFGDHMNDFEMLAACGKAYVPENGYPPLKKLAERCIPPNTEGGVIRTLKEILEETEP